MTGTPPRAPLPTELSHVAALPDAARAVIDAGLAELGLVLDEVQRVAIEDHLRLLLAWNEHVNLTAIRDPIEAARAHVLDALSAVRVVRSLLPDGIAASADIGSGGGFPGLPLGIALGVGRIGLVESVGRKARFLEAAGRLVEQRLGERSGIEVLGERAETLAAGRRRGTWDLVTVRAVGDMTEIVELALPLARVGGVVVCWKRERVAGSDAAPLSNEIDRARSLVHELGGEEPEVTAVAVRGLEGHRLVLVRKARATPSRFPRSPTERRRRRVGSAC